MPEISASAIVMMVGYVTAAIIVWIRARSVVQVRRAREATRRHAMGALPPGGRLVDIDGVGAVIYTGDAHGCGERLDHGGA